MPLIEKENDSLNNKTDKQSIKETNIIEKNTGDDNVDVLADNRMQLEERMNVISCLSKVYYSSYYINLIDGSITKLSDNNRAANGLLGESGDAREKFKNISTLRAVPEFQDEVTRFTDISSLADRLNDKDLISISFETVNIGWCEGSFIVAKRDENGKATHVIWAVKSINKEKDLEIKSNTDELTGAYNRRAYEDDISRYTDDQGFLKSDEFTFIALDVNGLKRINDNLGHASGDELICGAFECMQQVFGDKGRIYRIGGDEFVIIVGVGDKDIEQLKKKFEKALEEWKGDLVDNVSVSAGYVSGKEAGDMSFLDIAKLADKKMYVAKSDFYVSSGMDRRGQKDAYDALACIFTKIMKVNLTTDEYQIIQINGLEKVKEGEASGKLSDYFKKVVDEGLVHEDDAESFLLVTDIDYLRKYFSEDLQAFSIRYRRKTADGYSDAIMEMIPGKDYEDDNQTIFAYIRAEWI